METLAERIKRARKELNITQNDLSKRLGFCDNSFVSKMESGKRVPRKHNLFKLCEVFGWNFDDFPELKGIKSKTTPQSLEEQIIDGETWKKISIIIEACGGKITRSFLLETLNQISRREK